MNGTLVMACCWVWILVPLFPHADPGSDHPKVKPIPGVPAPVGRREYARAGAFPSAAARAPSPTDEA